MKTTLYFDMATVAKLTAHAANSTQHNGTFAQRYNENFDKIENPIIPPGLIWVKDEGIYLLSNGQYAEGETPSSTGLICYAHGFNPELNPDCLYYQSEAVGGDDFGEHIELAWLGDEMRSRTDGYFFITVSEDEFQMGWTDRM